MLHYFGGPCGKDATAYEVLPSFESLEEEEAKTLLSKRSLQGSQDRGVAVNLWWQGLFRILLLM